MNWKKRLSVVLCTATLFTGFAPMSAKAEESKYWPEGPEVGSVSAIVMEANPGKIRKSKSARQVVETKVDTPEWFNFGVKMALLAPTAVNQQKYKIEYRDGEVMISDQRGILGKVDLGIVKYHFEVGAEYRKNKVVS